MNSNGHNQDTFPSGQVNLNNRLRRLWSQLAMWRRDYLVSLASGYGDLQLIEDKLYHVTQDFGNVFETFFGVVFANRMEYYFTVQASILNEIANAINMGNQEAADTATRRLYENVDDMSTYLASINPYWNEVNLRSLFYEYYRETVLEIINILAGNQEEAIRIYQTLEDYVLEIADYLTRGFVEFFT
jgi:hypothetical protein